MIVRSVVFSLALFSLATPAKADASVWPNLVDAYGFFQVHAENCDLDYVQTKALLVDIVVKLGESASVRSAELAAAADIERPFSGGSCRAETLSFWMDTVVDLTRKLAGL